MTDPHEPGKKTDPQRKAPSANEGVPPEKRPAAPGGAAAPDAARSKSPGGAGGGASAGKATGGASSLGKTAASGGPSAGKTSVSGASSAGKSAGSTSGTSGAKSSGGAGGGASAAKRQTSASSPSEADSAQKKPAPASSSNDDLASLLADELPPLGDSLDPLGSLPDLGSLESLLNEPAAAPGAAAPGAARAPSGAASPLGGSPLGPSAAPRRPIVIPKPLLVGGAVGAGLLLIVVVIVVILMNRSDGSSELARADQAYDSGNYAEAVKLYDDFLGSFASHPQAERARLRRGIAAIQQSAGEKQWAAASRQAATLLPELAALPGFAEAASRLTVPLASIVSGLAEAAAQGDAQAARDGLLLLDLAAETMPQIDFAAQRLDRAEDTLGKQHYEAQREARRTAAIEAIRAAADRPADVLRLRRALLAHYPELRGDEGLRTAVEAALAGHAPRRQSLEKPASAVDDLPQPQTITPYTRELPADSPVTQLPPVMAVPFAGRIYAVASDGRLRWRRSVGASAAGCCTDPVPVDSAPDTDWVFAQRFQERSIVRVDPATGKARWRAPLDSDPLGPPVVAGSTVRVSLRGGTVRVFDIESGEARAEWLLPIPPATAPGTDAEGKWFYVPAEQLTLFALGDDGRAESVSVGHEWGEVRHPPVVTPRVVLLTVSRGLTRSALLVFRRQADRQPSLARAGEFALEGLVPCPMHCDGRRAVVCTDAGKVYVFRLEESDDAAPLKPCGDPLDWSRWDASNRAADQNDRKGGLPIGMALHPVLAGDRLWIAGDRLRQVAFDSAGRAKAGPTVKAAGHGWFLQPPLSRGNVLLCVQRSPHGGCAVSAVDVAADKAIWRTSLAVPAAGPAAPGKTPSVVRWLLATGELFESSIASPPETIDTPAATAGALRLREPLRCAHVLPDGVLAAHGREGKELLVYRPGESTAQAVTVPGRLAARPLVLGAWLLAVNRNGQAMLIDPLRGTVGATAPLPDWAVVGSDAGDAHSLWLEAIDAQRCRVRGRGGRSTELIVRTDPQPSIEKANEAADPARPAPAPEKPAAQRPAEWDELGVPFVGPPCDLGDVWAIVGSQGTLYLVKKQ